MSRKFLALFLLCWLPLFGGNALADSFAMQMNKRDCSPASMNGGVTSQHGDATQHHQHFTGDHQDSAQTGDSDTTCNGCGVCHFACSGFLAAVPDYAPSPAALAETYTVASVAFFSFVSPPLFRPPLSVA
jgi:NAD-dependent dihydropyrimidine dehydrogenase PreA subunit